MSLNYVILDGQSIKIISLEQPFVEHPCMFVQKSLKAKSTTKKSIFGL